MYFSAPREDEAKHRDKNHDIANLYKTRTYPITSANHQKGRFMINKAQQPENKVVFITFKLASVVELFLWIREIRSCSGERF
ncbi:hypothetical protein O9929_00640 [Vibrio lentus]|nr:hypothetical protein [Vibrio lentus]